MEIVIGIALLAITTTVALVLGRAAAEGVRTFDHEGHEMFGAERLEGVDG